MTLSVLNKLKAPLLSEIEAPIYSKKVGSYDHEDYWHYI